MYNVSYITREVLCLQTNNNTERREYRFISYCLETMKKLMQEHSKMISGKSSDVEQPIHSCWLFQGLTQKLAS